jgi:hypothetical protein
MELDIPERSPMLRIMPLGMLESLGNRVCSAALAACSKPFLKSLASDYNDWATGKERTTKAIDAGSLDVLQLVYGSTDSD